MLDFGSTPGSRGDKPIPPKMGHKGVADPEKVAKTIGSPGIYRRHREQEVEILYPAVGYFVSTDFNPDKYRYILPNPVLRKRTIQLP